MREFTSVCPYDCPDACGLLVTVDEEKNRVVQVKGNPAHSFTRGTLCPKLVHYEDTVHNPGRILTPLKRAGKKGEGKFTPISWEEAIYTIAEAFKKSISEHGGESILPYSYAGTMGIIQKNMGTAFFRKLGVTRQDRGICSPAKTHGWASVMGNSLSTRPQEAGDSDCIILWSLDALATDIHIMHDVRAARAKGAKIWVVDTHVSATMEQADEGIIVKPGSDAALALGMIHIMERDNLINRKFVADYVQGYEELKRDILSQYTPNFVANVTGISVEQLERFAHAYGQAKAPFIRLGSGLSRYGNGAMSVRAVVCLPAVVGAYAKHGGGLLSSAGGSQFLNDSALLELLNETTYGDIAGLSDLKLSGKVKAHTDTREMPMISLGKALTSWKEPPITSLYIFSSNPATTAPNQNLVRQGLMRDDLFVAVHERFMTDTAMYADIVLPATTSLEQDDIYNSYGHYTIGIGYRCMEPQGESKSNWEVFQLLAATFGFTDPIFSMSARHMIAHMVETNKTLSDAQKTQLLKGEPVEVTLPVDYKLQFGTPSGKIEILNPLEDKPLPDYFAPYGDDAEFWLLNTPDVRILDSSFNEREFKGGNIMKAYMSPIDFKGKGFVENQRVRLFNTRGSVETIVCADKKVPVGSIKCAGVWWQKYSSDKRVSINALTADRPTDKAWGSTFYDVKVNIEEV